MNGYSITQKYGYDPSYPLNNGYHKGIDYGCPTGTPIIVNGVKIGLSGATGAVTGPHLHVGRWVGGVATDPGAYAGFNFTSAVVYDTGYDNTNGNYVRITADGALWVYLHLSQISVSKGQQLKGGDMVADRGYLDRIYQTVLRRARGAGEGENVYLGKDAGWVFDDVNNSAEHNARVAADNAKLANYDNLAAKVYELSARPSKADLDTVVAQFEAEHLKVVDLEKQLEAEKAKEGVGQVDEQAVFVGVLKRFWNSLFRR